jgi:hypothetical protein
MLKSNGRRRVSGDHIRIEFTEDHARVHFDCVYGTITDTLTTDSEGRSYLCDRNPGHLRINVPRVRLDVDFKPTSPARSLAQWDG